MLACRRFTSASAACVFISFGAVMWDYAAVLFAIALVFTAVGQLATKWIMRRMHVSCLRATRVAKEGLCCWIADWVASGGWGELTSLAAGWHQL